MCGISGFNWQQKELIEKMCKQIAHRGPDATGVFCDEGVSLGHNRLSIIDLSSDANQPMKDNSGRYVIVFNGEIYNFKELKNELSDYSFKTQSDTEVILAGYVTWGKEVVKKLNGMFAFAIWDTHEKELFIARDHAGIKPLYYFWDGKKLIFASEIKAILEHAIPRTLDTEAFDHYMRVLYVPAPRTMIRGISKLPQGHTLTLKNGTIDSKKYVEFSDEVTNLSYEQATKKVREEVIEAVGRQLVADVPVGVYLSGGIDSSTVLFSMKQFQKNIKTFSVGFDLPNAQDKEKFNHDFELAKQTAEFFGVEHHPLTMTPEDVISFFHEAVRQNDAPVSNPTSIAMMFLARETKKHVTVVLTGNGGDELFGGYERYRLTLASHYYQMVPRLLRSLLNLYPKLKKLDSENDIDTYGRFMFEKDTKISRVVSKQYYHNDVHTKKIFSQHFRDIEDAVLQSMRVDRETWLPDQALELGDKMSMKSGLEERVPFLDKKLMEFVCRLPRKYLVTLFSTKKILKDAFRNDLPEVLFRQPKRGWSAPGAKWLRDPQIAELARTIISESYYEPTRELWNWQELESVLERHIEMKEYNLTLIWAVLSFQAWAKEYTITL